MVLRCAFFHLSRVAEDGNYYRPQRHQDADALYPFKSRGFGGEIGVNYPQLRNSDFGCER